MSNKARAFRALTLTFQKTVAAAGIVDFFVRPSSYNAGEVWVDPGGVSTPPGVDVSAGAPTAYYTQALNLPAANLTKSIWDIRLQRGGFAETYPASVVLLAVDIEYAAN